MSADENSPVQEEKHSRVLNCLTQLQSLNLDRPDEMARMSPDKLPDIQDKHSPKRSPRSPAVARAKAAQYKAEIDELIDLHREFSRSNMMLFKKVRKAVHLITRLLVQNHKHAEEVTGNAEAEIVAAMTQAHQEEKQKLIEVKTAFLELKASADKKGRIKKSKMDAILKHLGIDRLH